jgi:hypothetical protein
MAEIGALLGLGAMGSIINSRTPIIHNKDRNNKAKREKTNTIDIYSANNSRAVRDHYEAKALKRFRDSKNFKDTKIIPKNYKDLDVYNQTNKNKINIENFDPSMNSDSVYSDDNQTFDDRTDNQSDDNRSRGNQSRSSNGSDNGYHGVDQSNASSMLDRMASLTNNRKFESCIAKGNSSKNRNKFKEHNTWTHQYDQMTFDNPEGPVSINNMNNNLIGDETGLKRIEMERSMELDGGYSSFDAFEDGTYGIIRPTSKDFIHENMVPFVRKGPNAINETKRNMVNQMKLDLFTGDANNPDWRPKVERAPLWSPLIGASNIYGDPVRTDEEKTRYLAGNERRNELPFQQVKVTPGLDIGYNAVGKQGYHDMYRVIPTEGNVDNLRTLNNPKISYGSYVGPGQKGEKGPILGKVSQYKTPKFRERGTKDMVRGRSYITAPTVYGEYDPKNLATINRGTKESVAQGPAQHFAEGNTPAAFRGNYQDAKRENYKYDVPRNIVMYESLAGQGHNNASFVPDPTQREQKAMVGHANNTSTNKGYAINYAGFTPDVTKREQHSKLNRAGNMTGDKAQQLAVNYNDVADPTKRDQHNKFDRTGNMTGEKGQQYTVNYDDVADPTKRDQHNKFDRTGNMTGEKAQQYTVNYDDVADPTKRDQHNKYDRTGNMTGEKGQQYTINYDDVADPTKRDQHNKFDRTGNLTGAKAQQYTINYDDVSDPTKRDQHNKFDRTGNLTGAKAQQYTINYDDVSDPTKRDQHNKFDRTGNVTGEKGQQYTINYDDVADPTKRDQHNKYDRTGNMTGNKSQIVAINWDDVSDPTKRDQHNKFDRTGNMTGNKNQYIAINWDDVADPTKRDQHNKLDRTGNMTGNKNQYLAINWDDIPDPTKRDKHNKYDRNGNITGNKTQYIAMNWDDVPDPTKREQNPGGRSGNMFNNTHGYKTIDWDDVPDPTKREQNPGGRSGNMFNNTQGYKTIDWDDVPDPTKREQHSGGRMGAANAQDKKQGSRHQYMNMRMDGAKEALEEGRAPTMIGQDKGWTIDYTAFRSKDPIEWKWRPGPNSDIMLVTDRYQSVNTNIPNNRFYVNNRILSYTDDNLKGNPFVSNLLHKSI